MTTDEGRGVVSMSGTDFSGLLPGSRPQSVDELARQQGVVPFKPGDDVSADLWDSDEEFDEFLADLYASRRADLG